MGCINSINADYVLVGRDIDLIFYKDWNKEYQHSRETIHKMEAIQCKQKIQALEAIILYIYNPDYQQSKQFEPSLVQIIAIYLVSPVNPRYKFRCLGKHFLKIIITTDACTNARSRYLSIHLRKIITADADCNEDKDKLIEMTWNHYDAHWGLPKYQTQGANVEYDRCIAIECPHDGNDGEIKDGVVGEMIIVIGVDADGDKRKSEVTFTSFIKECNVKGRYPMISDEHICYATACSIKMNVKDSDDFALDFHGAGLKVELITDRSAIRVTKEIYILEEQ